MTLFWKKIWEKIKKYWQLLVGLFVGLGFALRLWWRLRAQKRVLKNEIDTAKKIRKAEDDFSASIEKVKKSASEKHETRVREIEAKKKEEENEAKKELDDRIKNNRDGSNTDLANKISESLGVNVVLPEDDDDA
jgi:hypothetical protein